MKIKVDFSRITDDLRSEYAGRIESKISRISEYARKEFSDCRCDIHGEELTFLISFGPNIHTGIFAGFSLDGCCEEFISSVYGVHFPDSAASDDHEQRHRKEFPGLWERYKSNPGGGFQFPEFQWPDEESE